MLDCSNHAGDEIRRMCRDILEEIQQFTILHSNCSLPLGICRRCRYYTHPAHVYQIHGQNCLHRKCGQMPYIIANVHTFSVTVDQARLARTIEVGGNSVLYRKSPNYFLYVTWLLYCVCSRMWLASCLHLFSVYAEGICISVRFLVFPGRENWFSFVGKAVVGLIATALDFSGRRAPAHEMKL